MVRGFAFALLSIYALLAPPGAVPAIAERAQRREVSAAIELLAITYAPAAFPDVARPSTASQGDA